MSKIPQSLQKNVDHNRQTSSLQAIILFLVWPLLAVVSAFRNYQKPWAKNIFWAFCTFFGFAFAIGAESHNSDIVRYVARIEYLNNIEMGFSEVIVFFQESGQIDILNTLISIVVSRFTSSQVVLTTIYGFIFGYFLSRNLWYLLDRLENKLLPVTLILLTCFFLVNPIWQINGFRMWTATHVFIYGLLPYLFEGKKKGLWLAMLSILIHFSFILPVMILLAHAVAGNWVKVFFIFYMVTFFFSEIDVAVFNNLVENYAPEILQERTESYRSEGQVEEYREGDTAGARNWYVVWYNRALSWSIMGFLVVLFFKGKHFFENNIRWLNLFCFTLLFFGVVNLISSLPSGGRFYTVANLCALALIILYIQNQPHEKVMKRFILMATPALVLYIVVSVRIALYSLSATAILGNPFIALYMIGEQVSLNDVVKMIL